MALKGEKKSAVYQFCRLFSNPNPLFSVIILIEIGYINSVLCKGFSPFSIYSYLFIYVKLVYLLENIVKVNIVNNIFWSMEKLEKLYGVHSTIIKKYHICGIKSIMHAAIKIMIIA